MNRQEIIDILSDKSKNDWLFKEADRVRRENVGDEIHLRALIEFSNICKRQCFYCGLRSPNKEIERYRLSKEERSRLHTGRTAYCMLRQRNCKVHKGEQFAP